MNRIGINWLLFLAFFFAVSCGETPAPVKQTMPTEKIEFGRQDKKVGQGVSPELVAKAEIKRLYEAPNFKSLILLTRQWRFQISVAERKEILAELLKNLKSDGKLPFDRPNPKIKVPYPGLVADVEGEKIITVRQDLASEGGRAAWAIEQIVHTGLPPMFLGDQEYKKKTVLAAYETVVRALSFTEDIDITKMSAEEKIKLAQAKGIPDHIYVELAKDPERDVRMAVAQNAKRNSAALLFLNDDADPQIRNTAIGRAFKE